MNAKDTASAVEGVRIFLRGAEIKRRTVMNAAEGKNTAVFEGLPHDVRPESISASVEKGGTLMSADFEVDSFKEPAVSTDIERLTEKLKEVRDSIRDEKSRLDMLGSEEKFLNTNRKIGGKSGSGLNELKDAESYHKERKREIISSKVEIERRMEDLMKEMERLTKEMGSRSPDIVRYAGRITVEFYAESKGKAEITVSYYVNSAGWRPFHEIRMSETDSPVVLSMKGSITQNTGEDWDGVNIKLSTGNPMLGNEQPVLRPWYIDLVMPQRPRAMAKRSGECNEECAAAPCCDIDELPMMEMVKRAKTPLYAEVAESNTTTEFVLPAPLDIPSSNKPSKVEISRHVLDAEFFYYCACRLDTDAFLIAKIGGWERLNLLEGDVSIFQGNEYVGKTHLDPAAMEDVMELSLGRDKGIIVTRERGSSMTSKGMIGKNKKVLREWIITVRNTRSRDVRMKLTDQLPISANSAVTVDPAEISGAEHDRDTGILTWSLDIPSGGSVRKVLRYEVTYPKNGTVHLD